MIKCATLEIQLSWSGCQQHAGGFRLLSGPAECHGRGDRTAAGQPCCTLRSWRWRREKHKPAPRHRRVRADSVATQPVLDCVPMMVLSSTHSTGTQQYPQRWYSAVPTAVVLSNTHSVRVRRVSALPPWGCRRGLPIGVPAPTRTRIVRRIPGNAGPLCSTLVTVLRGVVQGVWMPRDSSLASEHWPGVGEGAEAPGVTLRSRDGGLQQVRHQACTAAGRHAVIGRP
jgi:hypothetical protein